MLKLNLCRASLALTLCASIGVVGTTFSQDGAKSNAKTPISSRSIRPFAREETPANRAPDLYDASSEEFEYFREELGKELKSTRQQKRLEEKASRVRYDDPMDKPAADGGPFIDIYSPDQILSDGEAFKGLDDPDYLYAEDENNFLASLAQFCETFSSVVSATTGVSASVGGDARNGMNGPGPGSSDGTPYPMPTVSGLDPTVSPTYDPVAGGSGMGPGSSSESDAKATQKVEPSKQDDSQMLFPEAADNPYEGELEAVPEDLDFFKENRDFAPKAPAQTNSNSYMYGGSSSADEPAPYDPSSEQK